ncbi:Vesicle-associated membrane protein 7 [Nymphon striatum]|nr:Vesicle-associated membrane protein 7 [Nymphon striatum]
MLLYSAIARGGTILVSHEVEQHNFESVALSMLPNIPRMQDTKCTYTSDKYLFHVLVENGISYLCTAESSFGRLTPFAFLNQIKKRFQNIGLGMRAATAGSHELDREFSHVLAKEMENSTKGQGESADQLQKMRAQVNEVTGIMSKNIEKVLDRGDKLEVLVDKAADLEASVSCNVQINIKESSSKNEMQKSQNVADHNFGGAHCSHSNYSHVN